MLVHLIDPASYTPPYDDALATALAHRGATVRLYTSRFAYGAVPAANAYQRIEHFYKLAQRLDRRRGPSAGRQAVAEPSRAAPSGRWQRALKAAEHLPEMLAYERQARAADIAHFQWLPFQPLDLVALRALLAARRLNRADRRPRLLLTAHDILPREPWRGQLAAQRKLYRCFDAIIVHSEAGRRRLIDEIGLPAAVVHVIPHGVLHPGRELEHGGPGRQDDRAAALPSAFADSDARQVVLFFGLLRPYKGLDVLLAAWRILQERRAKEPAGAGAALADSELWVAGMPRMDVASLFEQCPPHVRLHQGYASERQLAALLARASFAVLPYRQIDASGAAFTALGAGLPLVLSDAGGFPEIAATGAALIAPAGDARSLANVIEGLLSDKAALQRLSAGAAAAARSRYDWEQIAGMTIRLYEQLLDAVPGRRG